MVHDRACHYLLPRAKDATHASTRCGQRQREDMATTQNWDLVDCNRCWYYQSLEIVEASYGGCRPHPSGDAGQHDRTR